MNTQSLKALTYNHSLKETGAIFPLRGVYVFTLKGREEIETGGVEKCVRDEDN